MSHRESIKAQLDAQLEVFDLKTSGILELPDGSWACQLVHKPTGELRGKVRADGASAISKCLENGYDMMADLTDDPSADFMLVSRRAT